ncbi:hypothetical protein F4604DRAFT_1918615 [Suillus subluteus]|nr:hypothetical protein F4604DRAFT_1918615 [Suillus subluteus]
MSQGKLMRPSNAERGRWRQACRVKLAQHIESRLHFAIEPSQVRLAPTAEDGYRWLVLPDAEPLFQKSLSDHSIGAYRKLYHGVGTAFEAVASDKSGANRSRMVNETTLSPTQNSDHSSLGQSSSARILELEMELKETKEKLTTVVKDLDTAQKTQSELLDELDGLGQANEQLQAEIQEYVVMVGLEKREAKKLRKFIRSLDELRRSLDDGELASDTNETNSSESLKRKRFD